MGTVTDLASIPRILRNCYGLDPNGISRRPAVTHDYLYWLHHQVQAGKAPGPVKSKDFCDRFLQSALIAEGMSEAMAAVYYEAVHFFGQQYWDRSS